MTPSLVAALERAERAEAHRGPDGRGSWEGPPDEAGRGLALAHRRLAILDLDPRSAQPMRDPETGNVIAFNGEIYNYLELRAELVRGGRQFRTTSDTEVLLAAWATWGEAALERLAGMFAFALWEHARGTFVLARDRIGIKPLYYGFAHEQGAAGRTLAFASEVRALLATGLFEPRLDPAAVARYAWHGFACGPGAIVQGIEAFPAGTWARVDPTALRIEPRVYWSFPRPLRRERSLDSFAATLDTAVREHLASDVPLAVFLSGGVDSSAIANLAARHHPRVKTFHVGFEEVEFDESAHARAVAEALGTEHHEIRLSGARFKSDLPHALAALDQPTFDAINTWFVSRAVREAGVVVALAGTGGDELFGGYRSFRDLPRVRRASRALSILPRGVVTGTARAAVRAWSRGALVPPQTRWGKAGDALSARGSLVELYQSAYGLFSSDFLGHLLVQGLVDPRASRAGLTLERAAELEHAIAGRTDLDAIAVLEIATFLGERLLRDTDAASMGVSLEARVPLLDHRVIEAAFALEDDVRFANLGRKTPLREVGLVGLDPAIFDRPKSGFVLPIERWCRAELSTEIEAVFADREACRRVGLEQSTVFALWQAFQAGAPGLYWSRVWSIYVLLSWSARHGVSL